jgi:hypothetical protein
MLNECFLKYKDKHVGKKGILFGTAPSVNEYDEHQDKFKDFIKFGSNEIIYKPYKMDYYFIGDVGNKKRGYLSDPETYENYQPNIAKFYRTKAKKISGHLTCGMPEGKDAIYYNINFRINRSTGELQKDITEKFGAYATISLDVLQFVVYTGIKDIYLIGHDCNYSNGTFKTKCNQGASHIVGAWDKTVEYLKENDVNVYSVNPVSLKIFKEVKYSEL